MKREYGIKIHTLLLWSFIAGIAVLLLCCLMFGTIDIPVRSVINILLGNEIDKESWALIVLQTRLPRAVTALFVGAALAVSGLMLQTVFNNPLAGPSILGIDAGASLGVAIVILLFGGSLNGIMESVSGYIAIVSAAFLGAGLILGIIIFFSTIVKSNIMLLIIGIMVGYMTSSLISLLNFFSSSENVFSYTMWGMGSFAGVSLGQLPLFCGLISIALLGSCLLIKPLNALLLGEAYAANLGVNVSRTRLLLLVCTGLLTSVSTAFCGPISFLGLAVPHMARLLLRSSNHKTLLPLTVLIGSFMALLCNFLSTPPGIASVIPLNAITPILGAPVVIYVIVNQKKIQYFN